MQIKDLIPWAKKSDAPTAGERGDHPLTDLQREMNRVFDGFWGRLDSPFGALPAALSGAGPRADVVETDKAVEVTVELPGMAEQDIDVSLTDDAVTVKGEKKIERQEEKTGYHLSERSYGSFTRTIALPYGVDADKAEATFRNGVLTVTLPKTEEARSRVKKVPVTGG